MICSFVGNDEREGESDGVELCTGMWTPLAREQNGRAFSSNSPARLVKSLDARLCVIKHTLECKQTNSAKQTSDRALPTRHIYQPHLDDWGARCWADIGQSRRPSVPLSQAFCTQHVLGGSTNIYA